MNDIFKEDYISINSNNEQEYLNLKGVKDNSRNTIIFHDVYENEFLQIQDGMRLEFKLTDYNKDNYYFYINKKGVLELKKFLDKILEEIGNEKNYG